MGWEEIKINQVNAFAIEITNTLNKLPDIEHKDVTAMIAMCSLIAGICMQGNWMPWMAFKLLADAFQSIHTGSMVLVPPKIEEEKEIGN